MLPFIYPASSNNCYPDGKDNGWKKCHNDDRHRRRSRAERNARLAVATSVTIRFRSIDSSSGVWSEHPRCPGPINGHKRLPFVSRTMGSRQYPQDKHSNAGRRGDKQKEVTTGEEFSLRCDAFTFLSDAIAKSSTRSPQSSSNPLIRAKQGSSSTRAFSEKHSERVPANSTKLPCCTPGTAEERAFGFTP